MFFSVVLVRPRLRFICGNQPQHAKPHACNNESLRRVFNVNFALRVTYLQIPATLSEIARLADFSPQFVSDFVPPADSNRAHPLQV